MNKRLRQKFKYLENKKGFDDKIKSIFHHFQRAFIEANKIIFLEGESPTLISPNLTSQRYFEREMEIKQFN